MMDLLGSSYGGAQEWLMQNVVLPILYAADGMGYAEDAVNGLDWFLLGLIQIIIIAVVFGPLEKLFPAEAHPCDQEDRTKMATAKAVDIFYTVIHRLGIFKLILYIAFLGLFFWFDAQLHDAGFSRLNVESWFPEVTSIPWVSFLIYLLIVDLGEYLYHRASHYWNWWWQLHALHHSQQHMTVWTDNRNHLLDDLGHSTVFAGLALLIGVEPVQYLWLTGMSQLIQSWQHGNLNFNHGRFKYFLISPRFHRFHHAVGMGHEVPGKPGVLGGCNFGVLFPWWDLLFGTAIFLGSVHPTGVRGLTVANNPVIHQWHGLLHSLRTFTKSEKRLANL